jgi:3',5'-cyclic AMP phosphodiesterase CpdA
MTIDNDDAGRRSSRRDALKCLAWAGAGVAWRVVGGVPTGAVIGSAEAAALPADGLHFVQISDTHFGFNRDANPDVVATARQAIAKVNGLATRPALILHTGDVSHLSKPAEFDLAQQVLGALSVAPIHFVPGEHDALDDTPGAGFRERFGKGTKGSGWYSFDQGGVHFVGLVNVLDLEAGGMGRLGDAQVEWLKNDVKGLSASTPVVVFSHIPLWSAYTPWGWGTSDAEPALSALKRFGSVTVLNGHVHQVLQKVEGNITFHSAMSTSYPQPPAGDGSGPGPLTVPADQLRRLLGVRSVDIRPGKAPVAVVDRPLAEG